MTADPKAPGAAAVYLNVEEITDDPHNSQSFYARIKVLTENGKELATVELPPLSRGKFKITDIKGRTIDCDGTVVPLVGKPQDPLASRQPPVKAIRFVPTVRSLHSRSRGGSILEYIYTLQNDAQF